MGWLHRTIDRIVAGQGRPEDIDTLYRISNLNDGTTICGMGDAAGYATVGILNKYRDEFDTTSSTGGRSSAATSRSPSMPEIFINGQSVMAGDNQTSWRPRASTDSSSRTSAGIRSSPWQQLPHLRRAGGRPQLGEIACNLPVTKGLRVLTDSDLVRAHRKATMQFVTLNHPVDCGICDKAGECALQDYHYEFNGSPSVSTVPKVRATKHHDLSKRIVLDNERCILCSRCVRFTHEISKSSSLASRTGATPRSCVPRRTAVSTPIRIPTT